MTIPSIFCFSVSDKFGHSVGGQIAFLAFKLVKFVLVSLQYRIEGVHIAAAQPFAIVAIFFEPKAEAAALLIVLAIFCIAIVLQFSFMMVFFTHCNKNTVQI